MAKRPSTERSGDDRRRGPRGGGLESATRCCSRQRATPSSISCATTWPSPTARCAAPAAGRTCWCAIPNGIGGEFFYQKRAPESRPDVDRGRRAAAFRRAARAEEVVPRDAAALAWMANLACLELHPHPVRADDLDHPDELRVDLDPVPGVEWPQVREVARVVRATLDDFGLVGWPKTSGSRGMHIYVRIEPRWTFDRGAARRAGARARGRAARARRSRPASGGRKSATASSSTTTRTPRTAPSPRAYSVRPTPDARVSAPLTWDEVDECEPGGLHAAHDAGALRGDRRSARGHRRARRARSTRCSSCRRARRREGQGDAPWPPHYAKQPGEPPRVQPSRKPAAPSASRPARAQASADRDRARARRRTTRSPASSAGRRGIPRRPRTCKPADVLVDCDARPLHHLDARSASTCSTCRRSCGRRRKRSIPTTIRGRSYERAGRARRSATRRRPSRARKAS